MKILLILISFNLVSSSAYSSDHIDGPVTTKHRVGDLTDLYAFPTPNKPGTLTVILNSYPLVPRDGHYSEKVKYRLTFKAASILSNGLPESRIKLGQEANLTCSFITPEQDEKHQVTCKTSSGKVAEKSYNVVSGPKSTDDFNVFAGQRSDPFFLNVSNFNLASKNQKMPIPSPAGNDLAQMNLLSLVIEISTKTLFNTPTNMIAIAAEALALDTPDAKERRLDRVGRPEITNFSLGPNSALFNGLDIRDLYNLDGPFSVAASRTDIYKKQLIKNLGFYDQVDGKTNWTVSNTESMASILANDFLLVDISKNCQDDSFLSIEKSLIKNQSPSTCGGRKPTDDIMDTLMTTYIGGVDGPRIKDGVDGPYRNTIPVFPHLAPPDESFGAAFKRTIALTLSGISDFNPFK